MLRAVGKNFESKIWFAPDSDDRREVFAPLAAEQRLRPALVGAGGTILRAHAVSASLTASGKRDRQLDRRNAVGLGGRDRARLADAPPKLEPGHPKRRLRPECGRFAPASPRAPAGASRFAPRRPTPPGPGPPSAAPRPAEAARRPRGRGPDSRARRSSPTRPGTRSGTAAAARTPRAPSSSAFEALRLVNLRRWNNS